MQQLWMDGNEVDFGESRTWGELLDHLESEHLEAGKIIRTIAFDEQELEDFRSEDALARTVDELNRVDVVTIGLEDYSRELLAEAPRHVDQVAQVLANTVTCYRQNLPTEGAKQLHIALNGFDMLLKLVSSVASIWSEEIESLPYATAMSETSLSSLQKSFEQLVAAQENGESSEIARLVDEELIPNMQPWGALFTGLHQHFDPGTGAVDRA